MEAWLRMTTTTEQLGHRITRIIADAATDILAQVTSFTSDQVTLAVIPRPPAGEPGTGLLDARQLERLMAETGISTAWIAWPLVARLADRINALAALAHDDDCCRSATDLPPGRWRIDIEGGPAFADNAAQACRQAAYNRSPGPAKEALTRVAAALDEAIYGGELDDNAEAVLP
jgi:hypothetical protein